MNDDQKSDEILSTSESGFQLSKVNLDAYIAAIKFCLREIGQETLLDQQAYQRISEQVVDRYPVLDPELQQSLSQAQSVWIEYQQNWLGLTVAQKQAFGFAVLSPLFGDVSAAELMGYDNIDPQLAAFDVDTIGHGVIYGGIGETQADGSLTIYED